MEAAKSSTNKTQETKTSFTPKKSASQGSLPGSRKVSVDLDNSHKEKSLPSHKSGVLGSIFSRSKKSEETAAAHPPKEKKIINPLYVKSPPQNNLSCDKSPPQRPRAVSTDLQHLQPIRRTRSNSSTSKKSESVTTLQFRSFSEESLLLNAVNSDCSSSSSASNSDSNNHSRSPQSSSPLSSPRKPEEAYTSAKSGILLVAANQPTALKMASQNHIYTQSDIEAKLNSLKTFNGYFFHMQKTAKHEYVQLEPSLSDSLENLDVKAIEQAVIKNDFSKQSSVYGLPKEQAAKLYDILTPLNVSEAKRLEILQKMKETSESRLKLLSASQERAPDTHYPIIEKLFRNQLQGKERDDALSVFKDHLDVIECHNLYYSLLTVQERCELFEQTHKSKLADTRYQGIRGLLNDNGALVFENLSINTVDCKQLLSTIAEPTRENRLAALLQTIYNHGWQPKALRANFNAVEEAKKMCTLQASPFWTLFYRLNSNHLQHALDTLHNEFPKLKEMGYDIVHNSKSAIKAGYHALINSEKDFIVIQVAPLALQWLDKKSNKLSQALNLHAALVLRCKETDRGMQQEADTVILEGQWGADADKLSKEQEKHLVEAFHPKYAFTFDPMLSREKK